MKATLFATSALVVAAATADAASLERHTLNRFHHDVSSAPERATRVYDHDRSEYKPLGARVCDYIVNATVGAGIAYDDNIYATETNQESDVITTLTPAIVAQSDWNRHSMTHKAYANIGQYADNGSEDFTDYGVSTSGRLDVRRNSFAIYGADFEQKHEDRGNPNSSSVSVDPTEYRDLGAHVGYHHRGGKTYVSGILDGKRLDYKNGVTAGGAVVDNNTRDRDEWRVTGEVGREVREGVDVFVRGKYGQRDYEAASSQGRNSDGWAVETGLAFEPTGKLSGEIYTGYVHRDYDGANFKDINRATYGANTLWKPSGKTSVQLNASQDVEETVVANSSGYIRSQLGATVQHELRKNVIGEVRMGFGQNSYINSDRDDDTMGAGVELKYLMNRHLTASVGYDYSERDSNVTGNDYDRNRVMFRLTGAL